MASQATRSIKVILAGNIREARTAAGLTQMQLATQLGVENMAVSRWERAQVRPSDTNMSALCALLSREVAWFYTDHESTQEAA